MSEALSRSDEAPGAPGEMTARRKEVLLVVPARPEMWSVVRVTASALAAKIDFTLEDIEDLRLAVTELCGSCSAMASPDALCECRFEVGEDELQLRCTVAPVADGTPETEEFRLMTMFELSRQILQATTDSFLIEPVEGGMRVGFLCKARRRSAP